MNPFVLDILWRIRDESSPDLIFTNAENTNRYCVSVHDKDTTSAYYFSVPIRVPHGSSNNFHFEKMSDGVFVLHGTNSDTYIRSDSILFKKHSETVRITFPQKYVWEEVGEDLVANGIRLTPTVNGIVVRKSCTLGESFEFFITPANPNYELRMNSKYFAIMKQKFLPLFTTAAICSIADTPQPLLMNSALDNSKNRYRISFSPVDINDCEMSFEMNIYEPKLIQDTTAETAHPDENNAFGCAAFVGCSTPFGEQELYLKFDYPYFSEIKARKLIEASLWLPIIGGNTEFEAYELGNRFCSFGATWNNHAPHKGIKLPITIKNGFCRIDLSDIMIDNLDKLKFTNGLLLKSTSNDNYCIIATGDNYNTPPVLEFKYSS